MAWGFNDGGQIGDGTTVNVYAPKLVKGIDNIKAIATGGKHSITLLAGGTLATWGDNSTGQFGDGSRISSRVPLKENLVENVILVAGGIGSSVIINTNGDVISTGVNEFVINTYNSSIDLLAKSNSGLSYAQASK